VSDHPTPGHWIKSHRNRQGLTQLQFAKKLKTTRYSINQLENNRRQITPAMAVKLERVTGVYAIEWLYKSASYSLAQYYSKRR
jgi:addiction module HigA family antidote